MMMHSFRFLMFFLCLALTPCYSNGLLATAEEFVNPIAPGQDPWVVAFKGKYYLIQSVDRDSKLAVFESDHPTRFDKKQIVWEAPATGPHSKEIWAPEMHFLDGHWYIYVGASNGENKNHRTIVLESPGESPLEPFHFKAELYTGDSLAENQPNRWAIDGTVLHYKNERYLIWSGWRDEQDIQYLYISKMLSPWQLSGTRVQLCDNATHLWERVGEAADQRGLHEAPQVLERDGRIMVVYSCSGSWEPTYKLGMLTLKSDGNPLHPQDWTKSEQPVFQSSETTFGVGHCCFSKTTDGKSELLFYHAKRFRKHGWERDIFVQPFSWKPDGTPDFGTPVAAGKPVNM